MCNVLVIANYWTKTTFYVTYDNKETSLTKGKNGVLIVKNTARAFLLLAITLRKR